MPPDYLSKPTVKRLRDLPVDLPGHPVLDNLSTDDPHWRRNTLASLLLAATAAAGARHSAGRIRLILAVAAGLSALPALSLGLMTGLALLLRRLERADVSEG